MKGEICTGPECDRPQMMKFDVCKGHRYQQKYKKTLRPIRVPGTPQPECSFEGCERPQMVRHDLCHQHRIQQKAGKPLRALGSRVSLPDKTIACVFDGCERLQMKKLDLCKSHRSQQLAGRPLTRLKAPGGAVCTGPECERPQMDTIPLCKAHRTQQRQGRPLTPIGSTQSMRKYPKDAVCAYDGCDKPRAVRDWCHGHHAQYKKGYQLTPLGSTKERNEMNKGYSETKTCDYCGETKNWKLFVIGAASKKSECRDCYRDRIFTPKIEYSEPVDLLEAIFGDTK